MKIIKTKNGDAYELEVTLETRKLVQAGTDIDMFATDKDSPLFSLIEFENIDLAGNVLYYLVKRQCDAKGVTQEEFLRSLDADCVERGVVAMYEEMMDFFPQRMRPVFKNVLEMASAYLSESEAAMKRLEESDPTGKLKAAMKQRIQVGEKVVRKQMGLMEKKLQKTDEQLEKEILQHGSSAFTPSPGN